ncbi:hypothetical protein Q1695_013825 [Nippostrongylus brasiliensis]|nr:hypothetical protein Q1695_013825 [Nippostrongylus brasiliensis]
MDTGPQNTSHISSNDETTGTATICSFSVVVRTSALEAAETDAYVFVQLCDNGGNKTDKVKLKCSLTHRKKYQRGHSDLFLLVDQPSLGKLASIEITHIVKDRADANHLRWHLHSIWVIDHDTFLLYRFPCGVWIGNETRQPSTIELPVDGEPFRIVPVDLSQTFE